MSKRRTETTKLNPVDQKCLKVIRAKTDEADSKDTKVLS